MIEATIQAYLMLQDNSKYFDWLKKEVNEIFKNKTDARIFVFGSSLRSNKFNDIDIGVEGSVTFDDIARLKDRLESSTFPFFVDIINFNTASEQFKRNVINHPTVWIKP